MRALLTKNFLKMRRNPAMLLFSFILPAIQVEYMRSMSQKLHKTVSYTPLLHHISRIQIENLRLMSKILLYCSLAKCCQPIARNKDEAYILRRLMAKKLVISTEKINVLMFRLFSSAWLSDRIPKISGKQSSSYEIKF